VGETTSTPSAGIGLESRATSIDHSRVRAGMRAWGRRGRVPRDWLASEQRLEHRHSGPHDHGLDVRPGHRPEARRRDSGRRARGRHALEPPLTKSARPVGDSEKVAQECLRGASGFERRAILPYQRATVSSQYWPFPASPGHRAANQNCFVANSSARSPQSPKSALAGRCDRVPRRPGNRRCGCLERDAREIHGSARHQGGRPADRGHAGSDPWYRIVDQ